MKTKLQIKNEIMKNNPLLKKYTAIIAKADCPDHIWPVIYDLHKFIKNKCLTPARNGQFGLA
jgi:hypothetical protein